MSRYTDIPLRTLALTQPSLLPAVDWSAVGQTAPTIVSLNPSSPSVKLPKADAIVMTWTSAEWAAMDHVFIRNAKPESPSGAGVAPGTWFLYDKGAPAGSPQAKLWGFYQLLHIKCLDGKERKILLFKSDAHLAHSPWLKGLSDEFTDLVADVGASRIFSIGTAGGANDTQNLGDVAITNAAACQLTLSQNKSSPLNNQTFTSTFFPNTSTLLPKVQQNLFFKLSSVITPAEWDKILTEAKNDHRNASLIPYTLSDLMNAPIDPANLGAPKSTNFKNTPLLTTDFYYIAQGNSQYAALEMDDAILLSIAANKNINFASIRNISDCVIVTQDKSGKPVPSDARKAWSSAQYDHFGIYTSFNGALAAWATLVDW